MTRTIQQIEDDIANLHLEREQAIKAEKAPINQRLAIMLHDKNCRHNHEDACGWYYEIASGNIVNWNGSSHNSWLEKANRIISNLRFIDDTMNDAKIIAVVQAIKI